MKIIFYHICLSTIFTQQLYNATEFIEKLRKENPADENLLKESIENTKEMLKHYIYYKVATDPPQPDFNKSYFPKIDFSSLFKDIKTKDTNYFDFSREFISEVFKLNDLHTQALFEKIPLSKYLYICPLDLSTRYDNRTDTVKMFGNFAFQEELYIYFKNYEQVIKCIKNNLNTPIKTINGKDPFTFIQEFAGIKLRSPHGTYGFNQMIYSGVSLEFPAGMKELSNFTVVYENEDTFTTDYLIQDKSKNVNNIMFDKSKEVNEKFLSYLDNNQNKLNAIEWNYNYISKINKLITFQCRVDETNHVNVMKINSFGGVEDSKDSLDVAEKCANLFDENEYRIIIIVPQNSGGNPIIGYNIIELLSPYILTRNTVRIKKDENMTQFIELYNSNDLFVELNSTNKLNGSYIKDGFVNETYGNETEEFSKPFAWKVNQTKIEEIKKNLKHKRKPNEIVILTDSFAFSSASVFMKNAYKSGAGIIIGYNGNPNLPDDIFDLSQSPSPVYGIEEFQNIYPEIANKILKNLIGLKTITCMTTFHEFQESHIPQEYDVQIVDKRIKIFNPYDRIYDTNYQIFIEEAIKVLDFYKENCNPKNKFLVKLSDECKFENHLHGGFRCGSDSKWNISDCAPAYCDVGYYYNRIANSCLVYPMENEEKKGDKKDTGNDKTWLYIIIPVVGIIIIVGVFLIIIYIKHLLCFKKGEKTSENNNTTILEDLMPEGN